MAHASADDGFGHEEGEPETPVMTDADFESALDRLRDQTDETGEVGELLSKFNEQLLFRSIWRLLLFATFAVLTSKNFNIPHLNR